MNRPTNSEISAPSKLPMVMSNSESVFRLAQGMTPMNSSDLRVCWMMVISSSEIDVNDFAQLRTLLSSSFEMERVEFYDIEE